MSRANNNQQETELNLLIFKALRAQNPALIYLIYLQSYTLVPTGLYYACLREMGIPLLVLNSAKPIASDVQQEFLRAFETPEILSRMRVDDIRIFALNNFKRIRECHCIDPLSRNTGSHNVRQIFASTILMQARFLMHCGMPVRIAILGASRLLQTVALMATLSLGGVKNFSLDLIERDYANDQHLRENKKFIHDFLKLISQLGFNLLEPSCPTTTGCTTKLRFLRSKRIMWQDRRENFQRRLPINRGYAINTLNAIVRDFSTSSSTGAAVSSGNIRINIFGELSDYTRKMKNGRLPPPTIVGEIDFIDGFNPNQDMAIQDLRSNLPNGTFLTTADVRDGYYGTPEGKLLPKALGVDLTAEVINNSGHQMIINQFFERRGAF